MTKGVALITGGSSGLGKCIALALQAKGWTVYIAARRLENHQTLEGLHCLKMDVTDEESVAKGVQSVIAEQGRLDVLVNGAGYSLSGAVEDMTAEELHGEMDVNLYGALRTVRQVLPIMRKQKMGTIVNIGSVAGFVTIPYQSAYSISKYALEAFNEALAMECRPFGVRCILVDPGDMKTGFTANRIYADGASKTAYRPYFDYAIHAMAKDELSGASPERCAKMVVKAIESGRRRLRIVVGFSYKLVNILRRILPLRLSSRIVGMVYARPSQGDELWSYERDVLKKS